MRRLEVLCDCCGACCETVGFPPGYNTREMVAHLPEELREPLLALVAAERKKGSTRDGSPCVWLEASTKHCLHHAYRPRACRAFTAGTQVCDARREQFGHPRFDVPEPEPEVWSPEPDPELAGFAPDDRDRAEAPSDDVAPDERSSAPSD